MGEKEPRSLVDDLEQRIREAVCQVTGLAEGVERHVELVLQRVRHVRRNDRDEER